MHAYWRKEWIIYITDRLDFIENDINENYVTVPIHPIHKLTSENILMME